MKELKPENVVAIIDTREQNPLDVSPLQTVVEVLDTGDYSAKGLETVVRIERKSLPDLVVEATWQQLESHSEVSPQWRGEVTSSQVIGSLLGWQAAGLSIHMVGDHERAGGHVARLLFMMARRRWRELRTMAANFKEETRK